jgi:LmbE family N-acetylglucosaminyl deacetylase
MKPGAASIMNADCFSWWFEDPSFGEHVVYGSLLAVVIAFALVANDVHAAQPGLLEVGRGERLLVVAPHPDDEALGAAGLMQRVLAQGGTVRVVLVTAGDGYVEAVVGESGTLMPKPADYVAYGERRLQESRHALRALGGDAIRAEHLLGFPDGGLEFLLTRNWQRGRPERSATTATTRPPYTGVEHPGVRYDGNDLRAALTHCVREANPTLIAFPDPIDRHPDHRTTGMFTLLALKYLVEKSDWSHTNMPRLLAYIVHWPNWPPGWDGRTPDPGAARDLLELPADIPDRGLAGTTLRLTNAEITSKKNALAEYASQQRQMQALLAAFVRGSEPFTMFTADELRRIEGRSSARPREKGGRRRP